MNFRLAVLPPFGSLLLEDTDWIKSAAQPTSVQVAKQEVVMLYGWWNFEELINHFEPF